MKQFNKLLQRQIDKYLGDQKNIPQSLYPFLEVINETYLHQEKDRKMLERSIELSSKEMRELNNQLRRESEQIKKSENKFRALIEKNVEMMTLALPDGKLLYISPSLTNILGFSLEEYRNRPTGEFIHPDDISGLMEKLMSIIEIPGASFFSQHRLLHKNGSYLWCEGTMTNMLHDPDVGAIVSNFRDITQRKQAEGKIIHANRLYAFISQINQTIVHVHDAQTVFMEACRIAIEYGKFKAAWIGILDHESKTVSLVSQYGLENEDVVTFAAIPYENSGPTAYILQSGSYYVCNNIEREFSLANWKAFAATNEFRSCMVLPIKQSETIIGAFYLFASEINFFDGDEIALLNEATDDISFALEVFEKERQRTLFEEKIRHNELRLNQAQKIAHFGSWDLDFATGIANWSAEACRIYGLSPDDNVLSYEIWISFIHPDDLKYVMQKINESQATLTGSNFYHRIVRRDGVVRHIHSQTEFELKDGKPVGLYGVAHDITDAKETEQKLHQSKANLRLIVDLIPQSIFAMDANGKFIFANKSFAQLYGLAPKQLVNKNIYDTIPHKNNPSQFIEQAREVIKSGATKVIPEVTFIDHTGATKTFYSIKVPFDLAGKNERAMLGISLDITEQKKAETERSKMTADIVQRNKDLEQFSYIVSHNLRAPVANIIGLSELFQIAEYDTDEEKLMMQELSTSVKKLDTVIKDLNYVLQVKHQVNEKKEKIKFSDLCADIKLSIDNLLRNENVKIITDFSAVDEILTLKSYLYSIFFNLISNSIKYCRPEVPPLIEITSQKLANGIQLMFKDNGLGIDLSLRGGQVFGLYKRFHEHAEGKGMGLFMVKTQVETLGGKISIESEVNNGTIFTIVFENI